MDDFQTWEAYAMPGHPLVVRLGDYELELYYDDDDLSRHPSGVVISVEDIDNQWFELARGGEIPNGR